MGVVRLSGGRPCWHNALEEPIFYAETSFPIRIPKTGRATWQFLLSCIHCAAPIVDARHKFESPTHSTIRPLRKIPAITIGRLIRSASILQPYALTTVTQSARHHPDRP
jgi:hypothetical protein